MIKVGRKSFRKYVWITLGSVFVITLFLFSQILTLKFDYDFEKFFPVDDPETDYFYEHRTRFQSDNDFLLVAVEREKGVFNEAFLRDIDKLTKQISELEYVQFSEGITTLEEQLIYPQGFTASRLYINFEDLDFERDSTRIFGKKELVKNYISEDAKSLCIYVRHDDFLSKGKSDKLILSIQKLIDKAPFERVRVAGRTIGQKYYIDKMSFEMMLFVGLSAFLIIIFLTLAFRSMWGIMIPQIVIFSGMIWVVGLMGLFNEPINIILTILPSIMFVVSMSDVIHLVSRYLDALREEPDAFTAIKVAVREVGLATLLTSVTTAVGFFSLYFVQVQPIQIFGIVMGVGVIIAFILTFAMLPALFYLFPGPKYVREEKQDHFWKRRLLNWFSIVLKRRKQILLFSPLFFGACIYFMFQIETNNYLMDDLKASEPLKQDFNYLDANYGGVRPFELAVTIKDTSKTFWSPEVLEEVNKVEDYVENTMGVLIRSSLIQAVKVMNRSAHSGDEAYFTLPEKKRKLRSYRRALRIAGQGEFIMSLVDSNEMIMRINGCLPDLGNEEVSRRNVRLQTFLDSIEQSGLVTYQITGTAHLFDKNMSYLSVSLVKGLGISILIVALIIGLVYQSVRVLLISIIPNVIPLLVIAGFMGFTGIELKTSTSIIFTIAFGIAVDDTIHFLGKFKYELMKGKGRLYALKRSYMTTGKAMILTTLILCAGFLLLVFSGFLGTFYMGLLLCITLFVALIADLTLLPVLLLLFYNPRQSVHRNR